MAPRSRIGPLKAIPWAIALDAAVVVNSHWQDLKASERERLGVLIRKSKGNPTNLTKRERDEVRRIVGKLDFAGMARDMIPALRRIRRR